MLISPEKAFPKKEDMTTKSTVDQLLDGSDALNEMHRKIEGILHILHSRFHASMEMRMTREAKICGESPFDIKFTHDSERQKRPQDSARIHYRWDVSVNTRHQVVISCTQVGLTHAIMEREELMLECIDNRLVKDPPMRDTKEVYGTLEGFVNAAFSIHPGLKYALQPLLDAGA